MMRVQTFRQVWWYSFMITALSMAVSLSSMSLVAYQMPFRFQVMILTPAALIPLLIALPVSLFALNLLRLLTRTIDQVDRLVKFDPLTGLLSRSSFLQSARELLVGGGCVMIVDADFFKKINDTYGHDIGDEALKAIAKSLMQATDPDSLVGRLGGEEFAVALRAIDADQAHRAATRILDAVRKLGEAIGGVRLGLTVSIGAQVAEPGASLDRVIKSADVLLYKAKRGGRDRVVVSGAQLAMAS